MFRSILICIILLSAGRQAAPAQNNRTAALFHYYNLLYYSKKISDTAYMRKIDSVLTLNPALDSLKEKLAVYQSIAWREGVDNKYRIKYWSNLYSNAMASGRSGSALYYIQKQISLARQNNNPEAQQISYRFLLQAKMYIYSRNGNYQQCIDIYHSFSRYLDSLQQHISRNQPDSEEIKNTIHIILHAVYSYRMTGDTLQLSIAEKRANNIYLGFLQFHPDFDPKQW